MEEIRNVRQEQPLSGLSEMPQTARRKNARVDHDLDIRLL